MSLFLTFPECVLVATINLPVEHDCPDTIPVRVACKMPAGRRPEFTDFDAVVLETTGIYEQDEVIRWQNHTQENADLLEAAYQEQFNPVREYRPEDEIAWEQPETVSFLEQPEPVPAFEFDQRKAA